MQSATENAAPPSFSPCPKPCCFDTFQTLTPEQVLILIKRAPDKTSDLDPVPTWLVQDFAPILHLSLHMFSMLVLKRVIFLLCRKRRLFIRDLRNHRWNTINKLLHRIAKPSFPSSFNLDSLPQSFATFFSDKIHKL